MIKPEIKRVVTSNRHDVNFSTGPFVRRHNTAAEIISIISSMYISDSEQSYICTRGKNNTVFKCLKNGLQSSQNFSSQNFIEHA